MTLIEQLKQLLTTASQASLLSFLLAFINQEDEQTILSYQGFDAQAHCHYLNSLKPVEQCSCERTRSEISTRKLFE
ncbi:MAG: hypothetical protein AB4368_25670 [Xenococcaceae cyanobacterium]